MVIINCSKYTFTQDTWMKKFLIALFTTLVCLTTNAKETVKVIIPFAPGGGTDIVFRHLQKYAEQQNINMVAIYKPGAEGLIGMTELANTTDTNTILIGTVATHATYLVKNPDYKFEIVSALRESVFAFVANSNNKLNSLDDLENAIKENKVSFAYGAPAQKMIIDQLLSNIKHTATPTLVPYKGANPAVQDVLGGHVDVAVVPMFVVKAQLEQGKLKVLATTAKKSWSEISNIPNLNKKYKNWESYDGFILSLPKNSSKETIDFWKVFIRKYLQDPNTQKDFINDLTEPAEFGFDVANKMIETTLKKMR